MTQNVYPSLARPGSVIPPAAPLDVLRPCLESQILVDWIAQPVHGRLVDLGCGSGYMAMAFALRSPRITEVVGVDINAAAIDAARKTASEVLGEEAAPVHFKEGDVRDDALCDELGLFNYAVCNPPFFERKLTARNAPRGTQQARAELTLRIGELCKAAERFLEPGGHFVMCHLERRSRQVKEALAANRFEVELEALYSGIRGRDGGITYFLARLIQ